MTYSRKNLDEMICAEYEMTNDNRQNIDEQRQSQSIDGEIVYANHI